MSERQYASLTTAGGFPGGLARGGVVFAEVAVPSTREGTMDQFAWTEQVAAISSVLRMLENQVASGELATPGLEDLKSALDDLRLRSWGLLMATSAEDHLFQQRFRIRRGKDMCRALVADLGTRQLSGRHPELAELGAAGRDLATAVDEARQQAF